MEKLKGLSRTTYIRVIPNFGGIGPIQSQLFSEHGLYTTFLSQFLPSRVNYRRQYMEWEAGRQSRNRH